MIAIEFDTYQDSCKNDRNKLHISLIAKSGSAEANEAYSLARNDFPPNFRDYKGENYIDNAEYKIRYAAKTLQVYINGALYLQRSNFDLGTYIGLKSN